LVKHIRTFQVFPYLPKPLAFLGVLSRNLWWSWKQDAIELFRRVDPRLWEECGRNPILFATHISQERFEQLAQDETFLSHLKRVKEQYKSRVLSPADRTELPLEPDSSIAYFSMEFGIHESLPLFAGGLGVLAGDHLKAASNMALPLIGIGLLYRQGYFRQYLNQDGWQQEEYPETDLYNLPLNREKDQNGNDLIIRVPGPRDIMALVWRVKIGRIPLLLLDTNLPDNPPEIRNITSRLYVSDADTRLAQEVLLGIGGLKALSALGIHPTVCHMNEGHCAFVGIERLAQIMDRYPVDLKTAFEIIPRTTVFTTHTPVAAGHDEFPVDMVRPYIKPYEKRFNLSDNEILAWGQPRGSGSNAPFSMFVLGLRTAQYCNGVSDLHGRVARRMWDHIWPRRTEEDVPITHVTNGIHISSFISSELVQLFERYLGPQWYFGSRRPENVQRIDNIYDEELWRAHEMCRSRLIRMVRELMIKQYGRRNAPAATMKALESVLDQDTLTIGFARRFATYKRAHLFFKDPQRAEAILTSERYPVQFIFAGKAHPRDNEGKELIRKLISFTEKAKLRHKIVFLEDYDMHIARCLVQGADIWLNNPRRPLEACGTSGMKAAINGVLNLSVLDGWWCEGYSPERGWSIGSGEEYMDHEYQDAVESQALYNVLENDVIPCFYDRSPSNTPLAWIKKMKASMKMAMQNYCSLRMLSEYMSRFYVPASRRLRELLADEANEAKQLSVKHRRYIELWEAIRVDPPQRDDEGPFVVNESFVVTALVHLGELKPDEVDVDLIYGRLKTLDAIMASKDEPMAVAEDWNNGKYLYKCIITCRDPGRFGFTVRVSPRADDWIRHTPGLITWA
jgi:starch phosphorylase